MTDHPYKSAPAYAFWRRSISNVPLEDVDPVVSFPMSIEPSDRVATAGSCFAQHIARRLAESGFTYFVAEPGHPLLDEKTRKNFNYGVFSARYGNIYTSRQLIQLFDRAYGAFKPVDDVWRVGDRFVDPFRPVIQPNGFATGDEYDRDRTSHLAAVRQIFEECDVFVFTLGLTEGYINRTDGAAYPVCPGVSGGEFDPGQHAFANETVLDVVSNLDRFLAGLRNVNPRCRVILTVSPVPLIATAEDRHVLQSTTYSKAVLRVAADEISRRHKDVAYYPSYEIVSGNYTRGAYFGPDLRDVEEKGVDHVMRLFFKHATKSAALPSKKRPSAQRKTDFVRAMARTTALVCEEELLDKTNAD
jgi:hypothetical protein